MKQVDGRENVFLNAFEVCRDPNTWKSNGNFRENGQQDNFF